LKLLASRLPPKGLERDKLLGVASMPTYNRHARLKFIPRQVN
jgi:hypothetical protein